MNQDLLMVLERVSVHYQPIVDLNTGAIAGFQALLRIVDADGKAGSIGPVIEQFESDPVLLDRLIRRLLGMISRDAVPLFERYPGFYVSVNVPPAMHGARTALAASTRRGGRLHDYQYEVAGRMLVLDQEITSKALEKEKARKGS